MVVKWQWPERSGRPSRKACFKGASYFSHGGLHGLCSSFHSLHDPDCNSSVWWRCLKFEATSLSHQTGACPSRNPKPLAALTTGARSFCLRPFWSLGCGREGKWAQPVLGRACSSTPFWLQVQTVHESVFVTQNWWFQSYHFKLL